MNDKIDQATDRASARRRLVRGAFAAPAVMTLLSGRALAATSATLCVKTQASSATVPASYNSKFVSVPRYKLQKGGVTEYWIKGSDVVAMAGKKNVTSFLKSGEYILLSGSNPSSVIIASGTVARSSDPGLMSDGSNRVMLIVDNAGNIKTTVAGSANTGLTAIAGTCWASFIAQP